MRFPLRLLLISVLVGGLYLQAPTFSAQQQSGAVTIRAGSAVPPSGIPEVTATVDRNRVPLGEEVIFTLSPPRVVGDPRYKVTLFFGDGSQQIMRQPRTVHLYKASGTYTYSILVQPVPVSVAPTPFPPATVRLTVVPPSVQTNTTVRFSADLSRYVPNIRFLFVFDDGTDSGWQIDTQTTHVYRAAGRYQPFVDIGLATSRSITRVGGSRREEIVVSKAADSNVNGNGTGNANGNLNTAGNTNDNGNANRLPNTNRVGNTSGTGNDNSPVGNSNSNSSNNDISRASVNGNVSDSPAPSAVNERTGPSSWWPYWIVIPLILLAAYQAAKFLIAPKPTFVPNFDAGRANLAGNKAFAFDFQLDVDPNLNGGTSRIETRGADLIKTARTE